MDTKRLRQFCAIAETGSLTKAAELLHITHSGLSKSMKLLQEELGCLLLRPSGRGLALTDIGLKIYQRAKEFLKQEAQLFDLENNIVPSTLSLGAVEIFLLPLAEQLKHHPLEQGCITLLDLDPGNIERLIANRELDFGITYAPFPTETIEFIEIGKYRLGCYHLKGAFTGKPISEIPFIVPSQGPLSTNPLGIKQRDGWIESIYPRHIKFTTNLLSTAIELTLQGIGAIYMPDFVAYKINTSPHTKNLLIEYPLPNNQKNAHRAFLVKHKDQTDQVTIKKLNKMIKNIITIPKK